jgi:hypothetical protein
VPVDVDHRHCTTPYPFLAMKDESSPP